MYEEESAFLGGVEDANDATNERERFDDAKISSLRESHPELPGEFLAYLREIGAGSFRQCGFVVYGWLSTVDNIIDTNLTEARRLLAFGDNFAGDFYGFLPDRDWSLAYLCHESGMLHTIDGGFAAFIRDRIGVDDPEPQPEPEPVEPPPPPASVRRMGCLGVVAVIWILLAI